jgi:peptidoglycan/xylan/chitin deacetylase (PgdA/CDA1 family)
MRITMSDRKHLAFRAGLTLLGRSGVSRLMAPRTGGLGAILMFHHVRPKQQKAFDPHGILEITPEFLDAVLHHLTLRRYDVIAIGEMAERIKNPTGKPFVVLTFDDGYKDNVEYALPILKRHNAPFTVFATTGFADGTAPLWWLDLEDVVAMGNTTTAEKTKAFRQAYNALRPTAHLRTKITELASVMGLDGPKRARDLCLDWEGLRQLASEPLCTIGAHTLTHPLLGPLSETEARTEMALSKAKLEDRLNQPIRHIAYPVGDRLAAGPREFQLARELGFQTGVTTRPGVVFGEHGDHLQALPRLSVNGLYQSIADFDVLLSGSAFFLFNKGRKLNVS